MKGKLNYNLKKAENSPNRASINNELIELKNFSPSSNMNSSNISY